MTRKKYEIPFSERPLLSINEAAQYFGIGEKKLKDIITETPDFALRNGIKFLIKRKMLEEYLLKEYSI